MKGPFWTTVEIDMLKTLYPNNPMAALVAALPNRAPRAIYAKAMSLGLRKTADYLAGPHACRLRRGDNVGAQNRFKPGHTTWNKGKKGWKAGGRSAETRFTKGRPAKQAHNYQPIGATRLAYGILQRKVTDDPSLVPARRWQAVHALVWKAAHGPIPPGHIVIFKPGQHTTVEADITLDRLECITRADNMRRNTRHKLPKEINECIQLRAVLTRQINKRSPAP